MTYTPSPNVDPLTASMGEQSQGVLALQTKLNAFGAGLTPDGKYGPLTQAAFQTYGANLNPTSPDGSATPAAPAAPVPTAPAAPAAPVAQPAPQPGAPAPQPAQTTPPAPAAPQGTPQPQPATTAAPAGLLQLGSKGSEVSTVQGLLGVHNDGEYGPVTEAAVKAFQTANGLTADGVVGPQTLAKLEAHSNGATPNNTNTKGDPSGFGDTTTDFGDPKLNSLFKILENQSPQKSFSDIYKEAYTSLGVPTMNADYADQTKAFSDLQLEKQDKIDGINNDPWLSEGTRVARLRQLDTSYTAREDILTNKLKLLESSISNARSDAQFMAGKVLDQMQQTSKFNSDIITKAIDIAEKQAEAEHNLSKPIDVSGGSTIYDPKTHKAIFTAPKLATPGTGSKTEKAAYIAGGSSLLEQARGQDGFVDPYTYKEAYDGWVNGFTDKDGVKHPPIGTAAEFATKFPPVKYVNPEASNIKNLLPAFLHNTTKTTSRQL